MTEMVTGSSQAQETNVSTPVNNMSTPSESHHATSTSEEKFFRQQEVNDIVGRAKHEAVERYKRSNESGQNSLQPNHANVSDDHIKRLAADEAERLRNEWVQDAQRNAQEQEAKKIAGEFFTKLNTGKEKYSDFDKALGDVEFGAIPHVVQLANMVDNTADVMYELAKHPTKIANIQQLISISPKLAYAEMARLSQSIKENETAAKTKFPNEPLSQMRPTNTGTDSGIPSVSDLRKKYKG